MEWVTFLVLPALTVGGISLGPILYLIKQMNNIEKRIKELESKNK